MYPDINITGVSNGKNIRLIPEDYPNPVSDEISLRILNARAGTVTFEIMDLTGKKMFRKDYEVTGGEVLLRCTEVTHLPHGIYLHRLTGAVEGSGRLVR